MFSNQSYKINILGEISDKNQEYEYQQHYIKKIRTILKAIIILMEVLNLLFLIPDYSRLNNKEFLILAITKTIFMIIVIIFLLTMDRIKSFHAIALCITLFETGACIVYLMGVYHQNQYDFFLQVLGLTVVIIAVFIVPNRLIYKLYVSLFNLTCFIGMNLSLLDKLSSSDLKYGFSYLLVVIILCILASYNVHYIQRVNYIHRVNLMRLSMTDYLTQTFNRGKLENELNNAIDTFHSCGKPLSLVMFDFDKFKIINDTFGHIDGDKLMVEVTDIVRNNIRKEDILARWGGDEFVILLPNRQKEEAVALAERLRESIANNIFNISIDIKCSFGVTQLLPEDDSISYVKRADQMLYQAKEAGGNCVKTA